MPNPANRECEPGKARLLFVSHTCYFDTYNGASVATRSLMECLARRELPAMATTGTVVETGDELDPGNWLAEQGLVSEFFDGQANSTSTVALEVDAPHYRFVPSRFAASYYRRSLDLTCTVLPYLMAVDRFKVASREPRYVTFVNPSHEKGVFAFARIADELGRRRPDIPLLVVEGRGTERTLVDCGLDLRAHGNVSLMRHTPDPRLFWGATRICVMPSLWWENQPHVAIEAMTKPPRCGF
jgi:glycosyltransferase involved in cell wall biosynthesis